MLSMKKNRKVLVVFLVFFWCSSNYNVTFKITNRLRVNNDNFKFSSDFKNHITIRKTPEEH